MNPGAQIEHLDVRGLQPPEPMERVLDALDTLAQGAVLCMRIDREPRPLYRILVNNGFVYRITTLADFDYELRIWHAPESPDTPD